MSFKIKTPCGIVAGAGCKVPGVVAFKGIRYATAGRWEYPQLVTSWEGEYDATQYGACCWQESAFQDEDAQAKSFYYKEFRQGDTYTYDEDCLFLNIWIPETVTKGSRLPVLVFIHGGAYQGCCGHEKPFDDPVWPLAGVIAVTLNYRVGPLGFACFEEATKEAGHGGNYGLYDQMAALQWIQDNIAAFGGDPRKVTIMGQSAGAMSVQHHCLSPLTHGLFSRAVMVSGGGQLRKFPVKPIEKRYDFWSDVMVEAGCENLEQMRNLPVEELFRAWKTEAKARRGVWNHCGPCVDGTFIEANPIKQLRAGNEKNIPYMMGSTSRDMIRGKLARVARHYCADQAREGKRSSFVWFFDRKLPGDKRGAFHSADLWYWFGTFYNCWRPMEDKDVQLSRQMISYLTNFAKCGDPNGHPLTMWEASRPTSRRVLRLGEKPTYMGWVSNIRLALSSMWSLVTRR
jgi:para-nitrobenzyl esterase